MWKPLRLLTTFLCAQVCASQISYRVVQEARRDEIRRTFPGSTDFDVALRQASAPEVNTAVEPFFGNAVVRPETRELFGITCVLIVVLFFIGTYAAYRRLDEGDMLSMPTQILTEVTVTDPVHGSIVYPVYVDVAASGEGVVRLNLTDSAQVNADGTALCEECSLSALAGDCMSGDCDHYDMEATNENMHIESSIFGDPHMVGLLGQKIDWVGEDGGWYCLVSDGEDFQLNVRVTAPMSEEFPDRQLVSGVGLLLPNDHSLVVEVKNPYTVETDGCGAGTSSPCLADGALRILVDNEEAPDLQIPAEQVVLAGGVRLSATNLPAECRPFGGDHIWAAQFAKMTVSRRSLRAVPSTPLDEWVLEPNTLAAPTWCAKYMEDGVGDLLATQSNHATLRIETPTVDLRINIGINHQELVVAEDGSTMVPELEFWQTDIGLERHHFSYTVGGMLGGTSRFVLDSAGRPIREGLEAISGPVESYRVADALGVDFEQQLHRK